MDRINADFFKNFDAVKRDFYDFIRQQTQSLNWKDGNPLTEFEIVFDNFIARWNGQDLEIQSYRYAGLKYELLFFLTTLKALEIRSKEDWILKLYNDKIIDGTPPFHSIMPLYDPLPGLWYVEGKKKVPQIHADFLILSVIDGKRYSPVFIDVKSRITDKNRSKNERVWTKTACMWHNCWFYLVAPKEGVEFPRKWGDWIFKCENVPDSMI